MTRVQDVRAMVPQAFEVNVIQMENPACATCELLDFCSKGISRVCDACCAGLGGAELAQTPTMQQIVVSRAE